MKTVTKKAKGKPTTATKTVLVLVDATGWQDWPGVQVGQAHFATVEVPVNADLTPRHSAEVDKPGAGRLARLMDQVQKKG